MKRPLGRASLAAVIAFVGAPVSGEPEAHRESPLPALHSGEEGRTSDLGRTAFVDIQELFRQSDKVTAAQKEISLERALIERDNRTALQRLVTLRTGIAALERKLAGPSMQGPVATGERQALEQEILLRRQELEGRERQSRRTVAARHRKLDQQMKARMALLLAEIRQWVAQAGENAGFDYVFDISGLNTNHVPPVLYAREAVDLTPDLLKDLNKDSPREPLADRGNDGR